MASGSSGMAHLRDHHLGQPSPGSLSASAAETGTITGTPNRRIAFSPNASSAKSASKLMQTPDRDDALVFSPTHSSGGFRAAMSADKDPFLTPASKAKMKANQPLSASAASFRPFYDSLSSDDSGETQSQAADAQEKQLSLPGHVSPILSTDSKLSRCLEFSCSNQPRASEIDDFIGVCLLLYLVSSLKSLSTHLSSPSIH